MAWIALLGVVALAAVMTSVTLRQLQSSPHWSRSFASGFHRSALFFMLVLGLAAFLSPWIVQWDPREVVDLAGRLTGPAWSHPLGIDHAGRDVLARLLWGARNSLVASGVGAAVAGIVGLAVGLVAGLAGGVWDRMLMRLVDAALAIPRIFLILVVVSLWGSVGPIALGLLLGASGWFVTSRLVRAEVLSLRQQPFLLAARAVGASPWRTAWQHTLPHVAATTVVSVALGLAGMILMEAGLGYLGIGMPSLEPTWGAMIRESTPYSRTEPLLVLAPGAVITATVVSVNLLGETVRIALNPRRTP